MALDLGTLGHMPGLRQLSLASCFDVAPKMLEDLLTALSPQPCALHALNLTYSLPCPLEGRWLRYCCRLRKLSLYGNHHQVDDQTLLLLNTHCCLLQSLDLGQCSNVTDTGLIELASQMGDLEWLNLYMCVHLTDQSLVALARGSTHGRGCQLRRLSLYGLDRCTMQGARSLVADARHLRTLELGGGGLPDVGQVERTELLRSSPQLAFGSVGVLSW